MLEKGPVSLSVSLTGFLLHWHLTKSCVGVGLWRKQTEKQQHIQVFCVQLSQFLATNFHYCKEMGIYIVSIVSLAAKATWMWSLHLHTEMVQYWEKSIRSHELELLVARRKRGSSPHENLGLLLITMMRFYPKWSDSSCCICNQCESLSCCKRCSVVVFVRFECILGKTRERHLIFKASRLTHWRTLSAFPIPNEGLCVNHVIRNCMIATDFLLVKKETEKCVFWFMWQ